jgi:hypothetical protein
MVFETVVAAWISKLVAFVGWSRRKQAASIIAQELVATLLLKIECVCFRNRSFVFSRETLEGSRADSVVSPQRLSQPSTGRLLCQPMTYLRRN